MLLTKGKWILIGVLIVLLGGTLTYFGWTKQKSGPASSQPEQSKPVREVVIPSSLDPDEAMAQFVPYTPPWGESITEEDPFWVVYLGIPHPHKGFAKGFLTAWYGGLAWVKKDGTGVEPPNDPYSFILELAVLKYEKPEFAREDYDRMSIKEESRESILEDVKLRTKLGIPPTIRERPYMINVKPEQCQQYLLCSNNFIIYAFGLKEASEDAIIRVIDRYGVE